MQRLLLFLGFMAFGSGVVYLLAVRETTTRAPGPMDIPSHVLAMTGVAIRQHENGGIRYELLAREAVFDQRSEETNLKEIEFFVFDVDGSDPPPLVLRATASRAKVDKKGGLVTLAGNVRLYSGNGAEVRSERIHYELGRERVLSPGAVWVKARGAVHQADSLIYDLPSERMTFTSPLFFQ